MAFFWILFGLLGSGLASAEEIVTRKRADMPGTSGPNVIVIGKNNETPSGTSGPSDDDYRQMAREIYDLIKSRRMMDRPIVGRNEFEVVREWNKHRRPRVPAMPHETFKRVKRGFLSPGCDLDEEGRFYSCDTANNDFVSGSTPKTFLRNRWDEVKATMTETNATAAGPMHSDDFGPDSECYNTRKLKYLRIFNNITNGGKKVEKLQPAKPDELIETYKSKGQSGCTCELSSGNVGCACCFIIKDMNIMICAGGGYTFAESKFHVRITVESFTLFKYEKELAKSAFSKHLTPFSKSLCIPRQFSLVLTVCLKLGINFVPSFTKSKPSKLAACPSIVAQLFLVYDVTLLSLPCWELDFKLPFLRVAGDTDYPKMTYEGELMKLDQPVKEMLAPPDKKNFEELGKLVYHLGEIERNNSQNNGPRSRQGRGEKWIQNTGEEPRRLKKGKPTVPINWEPIELRNLPSLVVLYTQPLASPLTSKDLDEEDTKAIPNLRKMTQAGLDRQLPNADPSIINLRVHAVLGKSCGGVILTRNKILTLCACIKFFYMYWNYKYRLQPSDKLDVFSLLSKDIYVTYAHRSFNADQIIYELDNQQEHFMKRSKCFDAIRKTVGKPIDDGSFTETHVHAVVMRVTDDFEQWQKAVLVPFLDRGSGADKREAVDLTIIGMRKAYYLDIFGPDGNEIDPVYEVVKVPFVSCSKTGFCINPLGVPGGSVSKEFEDGTKCFCAKDRRFQLCDGVVGFPLTTAEGVVGLNAIPMHCAGKGSIAGALFTEDALSEIHAFLAEEDPGTTLPGYGRRISPTPASHSPRPIHLSGFVLAAFMSMTTISHSALIA